MRQKNPIYSSARFALNSHACGFFTVLPFYVLATVEKLTPRSTIKDSLFEKIAC